MKTRKTIGYVGIAELPEVKIGVGMNGVLLDIRRKRLNHDDNNRMY